MPSHWGHKRAEHRLAVEPDRHAVPAGDRLRRSGARSTSGSPTSKAASALFARDEVTYLSIGEGTTSEGEFWESLNTACLGKLPVVYRRRGQRLRDLGAGRSADRRRRHLAAGVVVSRPASSRASTAPTSSPATRRWATPSHTRARARGRRSSTPRSSARTRIRCPTTRSCTRRRTSAPRKRSAIRSSAWPTFLKTEGLATEDELEAIAKDVEREVNEAAETRRASAEAGAGNGRRSTSTRPTSTRPRMRSRPTPQPEGTPGHDGRGHQPHAEGRDGARPAHRRVRRRRRGLQPRGQRSTPCSGKGGVFKVTHGLQRAFGSDSRLQLAARGSQHHRPRDRHGDARPQAGGRDSVLRLHLAGDDAAPRRAVDAAVSVEQRRSRARWSFAWPIGGYLRGGAPYHSQSGESIFAHCPGHPHRLPVERAGRRRAASHRRSAATIRCSSSSTSISTARPTTRANIPVPTTWCRSASRWFVAKATDVVVLTWGALVQRSLLAAQQAEKDGISAKVIDLRTIVPLRLGHDCRGRRRGPTAWSSRTRIS